MEEAEVDAITGGMAYGYDLLDRLKKGDCAPREDSLDILDAFDSALRRIRRGDVTTNKDVSDDDLSTLREIRELVATWNATGGARPDGLLEKVEKLSARETARGR